MPMFRKLALTAAAVTLAVSAQPAAASIFGKKQAAKLDAQAAAQPAAKPPPMRALSSPAAQQQPAPAPRRKATAEERAIADRMEPLARAAFWSREVEIDPTDTTAGIKMAQSLRLLGQRDEAIDAAKRVLMVQPGNLEAMLEEARGYIAAGNGFYAIEPLRTAQTIAPRDWRIPSLLGVAYDQVSRGADAEAAWVLALTLSPNNPGVLSNQAMHYAAAGDAARAEQLLRVAVTRPGAGIQERQNLALVLGIQGKLAEAEQLTRQDLPPAQAEINIAYLRAAAGGAGRSWDAVRRGQN
jgi:Flp pilus assembly protein TadD